MNGKAAGGISPPAAIFIHILIFRLNQPVGISLSLIDHIHLICLRIAKYEKAVSQKLHLNACILGIHRLDIKLFRADDLYHFLLHIILFDKFLTERAAALLLVHQLILILLDRKSVV